MFLVAGLGNPGKKYEKTRHNLGFLAVEEIRAKIQSEAFQDNPRFKAEISRNDDVILVKPNTFMNASGQAVRAVCDFYKVLLETVIVIHDDLDLPLGEIRLKNGGGSAGHHGVDSLVVSLGSPNFWRLRLGIGRDLRLDPEKYVLSPFLESEKAAVKNMLAKAAALTLNFINNHGRL